MLDGRRGIEVEVRSARHLAVSLVEIKFRKCTRGRAELPSPLTMRILNPPELLDPAMGVTTTHGMVRW